MDKHRVIVIIASVVIVSTFTYSFVNALTLENVEFRWHRKGGFDFISMMHGGKVLLCNTSQFPVSINGINMDLYFDGKKLGTYSVEPVTIGPSSITEAHGKSDMREKSSQTMLLFMDTEFSGTDIARIDGSRMLVQVNYNTSILGLIPFTVSDVYHGFEFHQIMNDVNDDFHC